MADVVMGSNEARRNHPQHEKATGESWGIHADPRPFHSRLTNGQASVIVGQFWPSVREIVAPFALGLTISGRDGS